MRFLHRHLFSASTGQNSALHSATDWAQHERSFCDQFVGGVLMLDSLTVPNDAPKLVAEHA
jgi:hypothetical protein